MAFIASAEQGQVGEWMVPRLLILNQMAGPITRELAEDLANLLGPCALYTGHPDAIAKGDTESLKVYSAPAHRRGNYAERLISWLHYFLLALGWVARQPRPAYLLLFSNPPFLPFIGYLMRRWRGQRYAVMVHDIYPDVLVRLGVLSERGILMRIWRWFNRLTYEHADVVMTLGELMAANLGQQFDARHTPAGRVEVVYPWADTDFIRPIPKEQNWFAQKYVQVGKLTVLYSGNMGASHDIETMLAAAQRLTDVPEVHFMFIGHGAKWGLVEDTVRTEQLPNVTLLPWQPEEILPYSLATADISLVSLDSGAEGLAVPSKAVYAMAAGSALLALAHGENELTSWIDRHRCGLTVLPGDTDGFTRAVMRFHEGGGFLNTCRQNARTAAEQIFSRVANAQRVFQLIEPLLTGANPVEDSD